MIASENFVPARRPAGAGVGAHQQVRRGVPGQAVLRRLRAGRHRREPRDRAGQGAVRRRARQRPAALGRDRERRRPARADQRGRQDHGPRARARRPPHARHEDQLLRQALRRRRLRRRPGDLPRRHGRRARRRRSRSARTSSSPAGRPTRGSSTSPRSGRSPTRSAPSSGSTWRTSPGSSPRACTRRPCRTPTSCPPPCTRRSAARGPASSCPRPEHARKIDSAVFPGQQGGPLMHVIAAKAVSFKIAGSADFAARQQRTLDGARIIAERLTAPDVAAAGVSVLTGGTDVHLVLVDLRSSALDGQQAEDLLHAAGITVNRNAVPFDPRPPRVTSGLRIGTPALATRGFGDTEFTEVADIIATALVGGAHADLEALRAPGREARRGVPALPGPAAVTAQGPRRDRDREGDQGRARRAGRRAARAGHRARPGHGAGRRRPGQPGVRRRQAQGLRRGRHRLDPRGPAGRRDPGRHRGGGRPAQRRPRLHRATSSSCRCRRASTPTGSSSSSTRPRTPTACTRPTSAGSSCGSPRPSTRRCRARRAASSSSCPGTGSRSPARTSSWSGAARRSAAASACCSPAASTTRPSR